MICIPVMVLNSIFWRVIRALNSFWAAFVALGIMCSLSMNFVCKPAIERCLRKGTRRADADTISTSAGCKGLRSFRLRFLLMVFSKALATSAALHHLTESRCRDEMIHSDTRQVWFVLWICVFACQSFMQSAVVGLANFGRLLLTQVGSRAFKKLCATFRRFRSNDRCSNSRRRSPRPSQTKRYAAALNFLLCTFGVVLALCLLRDSLHLHTAKSHLERSPTMTASRGYLRSEAYSPTNEERLEWTFHATFAAFGVVIVSTVALAVLADFLANIVFVVCDFLTPVQIRYSLAGGIRNSSRLK